MIPHATSGTPVERGRLAAAAGLLLLSVLGGFWFGLRPVATPPLIVSSTAPATAPSGRATITVHVSGAVLRPGLVEVPPDARVADAVAAAGGVTPGGDLSALNLAALLGDGQQLVVPLEGETAGAAPPASPGGAIRINQATAAELESLPGIGPVLADAIVAYRDEHGPFAAVEDLLDVPGIGEGKLSTIRETVIVP